MAKITEEQLKRINEDQDNLIKLVNQIGLIETQKHGLLHEVAGVNRKVEEFKSELEKEYGPINIDLETGKYEVISKEEESKLTKA
jgi:hypothetical protein